MKSQKNHIAHVIKLEITILIIPLDEMKREIIHIINDDLVVLAFFWLNGDYFDLKTSFLSSFQPTQQTRTFLACAAHNLVRVNE